MEGRFWEREFVPKSVTKAPSFPSRLSCWNFFGPKVTLLSNLADQSEEQEGGKNGGFILELTAG
jgi:hypothetical protein